MTLQPLITIGIPTYNRPSGLAHSLKKATQQTYSNLEILVSDNASVEQNRVSEVIEEYKNDTRVHYFRQSENLGSLGNFQFLVNQANGQYFLWMSDDDDVELYYIEELVSQLNKTPDVAIVMGGYDIDDQMSSPRIHLNLTDHLNDLSKETTYERMKSYILQPDHLAKSRLNWGMFPVEFIRRAFKECNTHLSSNKKPIWADYPIDLRLLSYGKLSVIQDVLWHVKLLPSSDGNATLVGSFKKLMNIANHTKDSMTAAVEDAQLTDSQKRELKKLIAIKAKKEKIQLFIYYRVIARWPWMARKVKEIYYLLFS